MKTFIIAFSFLIVLFFPLTAADFPEIEGWIRVSEVSTYNPENLWKIINGAADQYLSYGFQFLNLCDFSSDDLVVTVYIYDMGTRLNAFGIYALERPSNSKKLTIGAEAIIFPPYQCVLLKDCYYVKVDAFEGEITDSTGKVLLESIASALSGVQGFPEELLLLPSKEKVSDSESFVREGYIGLSELSNCIFARYIGKDEREYQYFIVIPDSGKSIESVWQKLARTWSSMEHKECPVLFRKIPYKGIVGVVLTEKGIFGVSDSADETEMLKKLEIILNL